MRSVLWAVVSMALFTVSLSAQDQISDDAQIDTILGQEAITWAQAAWLVGRATGAFDEGVTPEEAAERAAKSGWADTSLREGRRLELQSLSHLLVEALEIPGGFLYSWFPGPRYALRELVYRKIIPGSLDPESSVPGEEALRYLQLAQDWKENLR